MTVVAYFYGKYKRPKIYLCHVIIFWEQSPGILLRNLLNKKFFFLKKKKKIINHFVALAGARSLTRRDKQCYTTFGQAPTSNAPLRKNKFFFDAICI